MEVVASIEVVAGDVGPGPELAALGFHVGNNNQRFLTCRDFERIGDYQPENCRP